MVTRFDQLFETNKETRFDKDTNSMKEGVAYYCLDKGCDSHLFALHSAKHKAWCHVNTNHWTTCCGKGVVLPMEGTRASDLLLCVLEPEWDRGLEN